MTRLGIDSTNRGSIAKGLGLAAATAVALAACSTTSSPSSSSTSVSNVGTGPGQCGSIPTVAPNDPNSVLSSTLPAGDAAQYNGYTDPIVASAWANWTNPAKPPWKIGFVINTLANPFNAEQASVIQAAMAGYKAEGLVSTYTVLSTNNNATTELQDVTLLTQQGYNGILLSPTSVSTVTPAVDAAGAKGIPFVTFFGSVPDKYVVNEGPNTFLFAGSIAAAMARELNGKGNILYVRGVPGLPFDTQSYDATAKVLSLCPNIHIVGSVNGEWDPSVAKTETLKFLATHPGTIDGVMDSGPANQQGALQAFLQAGRPVPIIGDVGGMQATIAYWALHTSSYKGAGAGIGPEATGQKEAEMMMRILLGQGPKLNAVLFDPPAITSSNLSEWDNPSWTISSTLTADAPQDLILPDSYVYPLLNHPGPILGPST